MALIDKADLEQRLGVAEVVRYSRGSNNVANDGNINDAIARAESRMRSEAIKVFTPASWDAMTSGTVPAVAVIHLVSDAVDLLSSSSNRSAAEEDIVKKAEEARLFRIRLSRNEERCFDDVLARVEISTGGPRARVGAPSSRVFDMDDTSSGLYSRHSGR